MLFNKIKKFSLISLTVIIIFSGLSSLASDWKITDLPYNNKSKIVGGFTENKDELTLDFKSKIQREKINTNNSFLVNKYINNENCDKILSNDGYFTTCYDYNLKGALYGYLKLYGSNVHSKNIEKRDNFYQDLNIPKEFRTLSGDYTNSGFHRGHSIANDASFDYSEESKKSTYVMSNIVPQYPKTNTKSYLSVENYERFVSVKLGEVEVLTINFYNNNPKKIGKSGVSVPDGFAKILWNNNYEFQRCFYIPNDDVVYKLADLEISCKSIIK